MGYLSLCAWVYLHTDDMLQSKPQLRHYIMQGFYRTTELKKPNTNTQLQQVMQSSFFIHFLKMSM